MGMFKNVLYNTEGLFSNVFVQRAVGNLMEALMASSYHLNQWSSLFPCLSNEKNGIYLTRPCGDSVNEIIHRNTGTDIHISQQVKNQHYYPYGGCPTSRKSSAARLSIRHPGWSSLKLFLGFCGPDCAYVVSHFSRVWLFATPQTVAHQVPLSMGFSRQECWSGPPSPSPGDLPKPRIKLPLLVSCFGRRVLTTSATWEALIVKSVLNSLQDS